MDDPMSRTAARRLCPLATSSFAVIALLGLVLLVLGILKLVGILAIGSASATILIVIGIVCILVAQFVLGGVYGSNGNTRGRVF